MVNALVQIMGIALFVAWMWPPLLGYVGLEPVARWMSASMLHRIALMPVLLVVTVIAHTTQRSQRSARQWDSWEPFAHSVGGELLEAPPRIEAGMWLGGPTLRVQLQNGPLTYEVVRQGDEVRTRVRTRVENTGGLAFHLAGPQPGRRAMEKVALPLARAAFAIARAEAKNPEQRGLIERLSFLSSPGIPTGQSELDGAVSLHASDAEAARQLLAAPGVCGALHRLMLVQGWSWSLAADGTAGAGLMELQLPGVERELEHLQAVHELMREAVDYFAGLRAAARA